MPSISCVFGKHANRKSRRGVVIFVSVLASAHFFFASSPRAHSFFDLQKHVFAREWRPYHFWYKKNDEENPDFCPAKHVFTISILMDARPDGRTRQAPLEGPTGTPISSVFSIVILHLGVSFRGPRLSGYSLDGYRMVGNPNLISIYIYIYKSKNKQTPWCFISEAQAYNI